MATPWAQRYAQRTQTVKSSIIRELLRITQRPEVISFAGGLPAPEVFPAERFRDACERVLSTQAATALQYGPTEGYRPLREFIVAQMARYGIIATVDNVLITSGSQQALDLIAKLLINRGDRILTECPSYLGALQAFSVFGAQYVTVPVDDEGLQTSQLESALRSGPKFMYILPNFQNPSGVTLSRERREELNSHHRRRSVWPAALRGRPHLTDRNARSHGTGKRRGIPAGKCDLPEHVLQGDGSGAAPGLDCGSAGGDRPVSAAQAERGPAHQYVYPDGGV